MSELQRSLPAITDRRLANRGMVVVNRTSCGCSGGSDGPTVSLGSGLRPLSEFSLFPKPRSGSPPGINKISVQCLELLRQKESTPSQCTRCSYVCLYLTKDTPRRKHDIIAAGSHWPPVPRERLAVSIA